MRCLLPLPVTVMASPGRARHIAALEPKRFGNAQPRAIKQRQHRGVARKYPGLALFAGAQIGVGRCAWPMRSRAASAASSAPSARARRRAPRPCLCRCARETRERAHARERPHQRAAADAVGAPRRHEGAHVLRRELGELGERGRAAEVLGHEGEELRRVALVGVERFRRHPPLGAEMDEPALDLGRDVVASEGGAAGPAVLSLTRRGYISPPSFTLP